MTDTNLEMDNQQPRSLEDRLLLLILNARFGDGTLWKHPECKNYKMVFTSTTPELLDAKYQLAPEVFKTGPKFQDLSKAAGRYKNAKPMYRLASTVHTMITEFKLKSKLELINMLSLESLALWYLDDGSTIERVDSTYGYTRSYLYIGDACETDEMYNAFKARMSSIFNADDIGAIKRHTPFTSDKNKVWNIPVRIAELILEEASKYSVLKHKFPSWIRFRDHSRGEVASKGKSTRSARTSDLLDV